MSAPLPDFEQQLFEQLSRHLSEPLLVVSPSGTILGVSASIEALLGHKAQELFGKDITALAKDAPEKVEEYLRLCARTLSPLPGGLRLLCASGREVACRCLGALLAMPKIGAPRSVLLRLVAKDEVASQQAFSLLNEQVASLTREVTNRKRAEDAALEALRARDEFLSVASHELKTPIQALFLQLEILASAAEGFDAPARERLATNLGRARRQVERLAALSTSLLDVSGIQSGEIGLQLRKVDVGAAVRAGVGHMHTHLESAGCSLRLALEPHLFSMVDVSRLDQIVANLLSNAAKYGAGKSVSVSVRAVGETVCISVADEGIGIATENLARVFGKFERAVSAENYGGLGLGLFITRYLVEAMAGSIDVSSTIGQGSTFTLRFPKASSTLDEATLAADLCQGSSSR